MSEDYSVWSLIGASVGAVGMNAKTYDTIDESVPQTSLTALTLNLKVFPIYELLNLTEHFLGLALVFGAFLKTWVALISFN